MDKKVNFVVGDRGPSGYYRLILPCQTLKEGGVDAGFAFARDDFAAADILVFQRQHRAVAIDEILKWQSLGKTIVIDFDDNFLELDPTNKANRIYTPAVISDLKRLVVAADAVTVATGPLAKAYGAFAKKVFVIPNALPAKAFDKAKRPSNKVIVGWHGSDSHGSDLKLIKSVLVQIERKYDVEIVLAGYNPPGLFRKITFRPWVQFSQDLAYYDSFADFTIGLCPLSRSPFNDCKSDLKWLEYSSLAIPTVVSAAKPYEAVEHGVTGLLARNLNDWEANIARLIEDEGLRAQLGEAARAYAKANRTIEKTIGLWRDLLATL